MFVLNIFIDGIACVSGSMLEIEPGTEVIYAFDSHAKFPLFGQK
jgi:hypothetical protein